MSSEAERQHEMSAGRSNVMRHTQRQLTPTEQRAIGEIKDIGLSLYSRIEQVGQSRELSLAKTKVEEAVMWAVKAISG